ncbi:MAG: hypothetical protein JSS65_00685 [Armatimonadetes bacterium]|nr:hypothetical protein [Armatimonadota bacterium]
MQYLVAIHHPHGYDGSKESPQMGRDIDALNDEMQAAGVRIMARGLRPPTEAKTLRKGPDGKVSVSDGPYLETKEYIGGFWILDCASIEDAVEWGKKAVGACRVNVEVRPFYG